MDERKLIKLGNSSFAISLPKSWIDKANLSKGDTISLVENSNGEIIINPAGNGKDKMKIKEINISSVDEYSLNKEIQAAYIRGYDEIIFKGENNKEIKNKIKEKGDDLLSFEVVESDDNKVVIRDFFDLKNTRIDNFIHRIDNNVREAFDLILNGLESKRLEKKHLDEIMKIDKDINKLYMIISRLMFRGLDNPSLLSALELDGQKLFSKWWVVFNLEHIGDGFKDLGRVLNKYDIEEKNNLKDFLNEIKEVYLESMKSFYEENKESSFLTMKKSFETFKKYGDSENGNIKSQSKSFEILKSLQDACYQNLKMVVYMKT